MALHRKVEFTIPAAFVSGSLLYSTRGWVRPAPFVAECGSPTREPLQFSDMFQRIGCRFGLKLGIQPGNPLNKTALIVDDSKSARVVLKRILEAHELDVDTAESAESALDYLTVHRPDVIFMDHLMPGMDGFQAVKAIKNNPDTATIPIMMYTSQRGEVYVGQARALGAVGVLPKQVEPVEVSKVLESLHVIGDEDKRREHHEESVAAEASGTVPSLERLDQDLRDLIQDLFDQQRAVMRRDLLDSYEVIAARVADEIRSPDADEATAGRDGDRLPGRVVAIVSALIVVIVVFAGLYWQRERSWREVQQQNVSLLNAVTQQQSIEAEGAMNAEQRLNQYQQSLNTTLSKAVSALEWSVNQAGQYPFGETALGDARLALFKGLVQHLLNMGFSGRIHVETHVGDFCMVAGESGGFDLAPANYTVSQCEQIGFKPAAAFEMGSQQSVAFANFANTIGEETSGSIEITVTSRGSDEPVVPYPQPTADVTAGLWNGIAQQNNRVEVRIEPFDQ